MRSAFFIFDSLAACVACVDLSPCCVYEKCTMRFYGYCGQRTPFRLVPGDLSATEFEIDSGVCGFKKLRTSFGLPSIKPMILGDLVAKLTSRLAFRLPSTAYQLVAVYKKLDDTPNLSQKLC